MKWLLPAVFALGACAALPSITARPTALRLGDEVMTLALSDGSLCRAHWRAAASGPFEACAGFGYEVRLEQNPNLLRKITQDLDLALGGGLTIPMAQVVITDPRGRDYLFTTPADFK